MPLKNYARNVVIMIIDFVTRRLVQFTEMNYLSYAWTQTIMHELLAGGEIRA